MASKRSNSDQSGTQGPPAKKMLTQFESVKLGPIYSLEELDVKTLQFQNKKLAERIEQRRLAEEELRSRIDQLEKRQTADDAVLMIVNRYWNTLDEDVRVLLQRFDAETTDEDENKNESSELAAFLALLSTWDKQELEVRLQQRVEFSLRAIRKLLQAFDRLQQRNEKLHRAIENRLKDEEKSQGENEVEAAEKKPEIEVEGDGPLKSIPPKRESVSETEKSKDTTDSSMTDGMPDGETDKATMKSEPKDDYKQPMEVTKIKIEPGLSDVIEPSQHIPDSDSKNNIRDILREVREVIEGELASLREENQRLDRLTIKLQQQHHQNTLTMAELQEKFNAAETERAELKNKVEDLEYNFDQSQAKVGKFDRHLADLMKRMSSYDDAVITTEGGKSVTGVSRQRFDEILSESEEQRESAQSRLTELEQLSKDYQESQKEGERLKLDLKLLPETVVVETAEYKCLKSQFAVLYSESMQLKEQMDEYKNMLHGCKEIHIRQIEQMESDELFIQKKLRTEMIQLEDTLAQVRKEYEMLRIEFEQNLAANEQTGPINREMRNLIQSLQSHNQQLKKDIGRYKHRCKEFQCEINKLKIECSSLAESKEDAALASSAAAPKVEEPIIIKQDEEEKKEEMREKGKTDGEIIKELKSQLKKAQDSQKELKLLLDMYKSAPKEQRDKVQLMAAEKKAKQEIDDLKNHIRKMLESERKEKRKLADEEAIKKIQRMEDSSAELHKTLDAQKQREEALMNEMEVTGQAFEDMQEQNSRLIQQLRVKDDANFKLMSERIKASQIHKLLREEKELISEQTLTLQSQVEAQMLVVRKLEEKERILQNTLSNDNKELGLCRQAMEMHKRKALESTQTATDLKLHLDKYQSQLKEAQTAVADKTETLEKQSFKHRRTQEEIARLQRKLERQKKIEVVGAADEVLMAEIQEYKDQLTCPSCKVKRKDAVLTKCFHVFCLECLKTRYETRQRKCPKCNAGFGANDYHRLFLA